MYLKRTNVHTPTHTKEVTVQKDTALVNCFGVVPCSWLSIAVRQSLKTCDLNL